MLSFDNTIISRAEEGHERLKRALETSTEDLKKMINVIELILKNERAEFMIAHEEAKTRLSRSCNVTSLKNLQIFISSYALKLIRLQVNKMTRVRHELKTLSSCTKTYERSMRLPCAHLIERRNQDDDMIRLENVHSH
jgi:hypothetical protein